MSPDQVDEWEAYDRIDPIGSWREDYKMAYLTSTVLNIAVQLYGKEGARLQNPVEIMKNFPWLMDPSDPQPKQASGKQTIEQIKNVMMDLVRMGNRPPKQKANSMSVKRRKSLKGK
jgi:hypothetical protein